MADRMKETTELRLKIDEYRLDEEWVGQPRMYFEWARKHAAAVLRLDKAKSNLELTKADVDASVRATPSAYGITKITEKGVEAAVVATKDHQDAVNEVSQAKHDAAVVKAAVEALDQRKAALENLVRLHGQSYYANPRAEGEDKEALETARKRSIRRGKKRDR
jgi:hypothetical protein